MFSLQIVYKIYMNKKLAEKESQLAEKDRIIKQLQEQLAKKE